MYILVTLSLNTQKGCYFKLTIWCHAVYWRNSLLSQRANLPAASCVWGRLILQHHGAIVRSHGFGATNKTMELQCMSITTYPDVDLRSVLTLKAEMTLVPLQGQIGIGRDVVYALGGVIYTDWIYHLSGAVLRQAYQDPRPLNTCATKGMSQQLPSLTAMISGRVWVGGEVGCTAARREGGGGTAIVNRGNWDCYSVLITPWTSSVNNTETSSINYK